MSEQSEQTYHFIERITRSSEDAKAFLYGCDKCGAVVERDDFELHDQWHADIGSPGVDR